MQSCKHYFNINSVSSNLSSDWSWFLTALIISFRFQFLFKKKKGEANKSALLNQTFHLALYVDVTMLTIQKAIYMLCMWYMRYSLLKHMFIMERIQSKTPCRHNWTVKCYNFRFEVICKDVNMGVLKALLFYTK